MRHPEEALPLWAAELDSLLQSPGSHVFYQRGQPAFELKVNASVWDDRPRYGHAIPTALCRAVLTKQADRPWHPTFTTQPDAVVPGDRCQPLPSDDELDLWVQRGSGCFSQAAAQVIVDAGKVKALRHPDKSAAGAQLPLRSVAVRHGNLWR